jgi:thioredoxin 1
MIVSITRNNFDAEVKNSKKPVVIDVFATWCGPCQHMAPFFEELSQEFSEKYTFGTINIDEARDIAVEFGIMSVPTFLFLKNGELVSQEVGYMSKEQLHEKIATHLGS